jgi:hypothetical protein
VIGSDWFLLFIEALFWPSVSPFFMFFPRTFSPYLSPYLSTYLSPFVFSVVISLTCLPILIYFISALKSPNLFSPCLHHCWSPYSFLCFALCFSLFGCALKWQMPAKWGSATWMYDEPLEFQVLNDKASFCHLFSPVIISPFWCPYFSPYWSTYFSPY